ncbi:MAG: ROK family protein [Chthonomonadales bacterium]|nr:ROK family protein [Chthonomonadales bacterium]
MDRVFLGVDIGGTKCAVTLGTPDGAILDRLAMPTQAETGPAAIMERLISLAHELTASSGHPIAGIGISCGGPLDTRTGMVYSPPNLPGWEGIPVRSMFEDAFAGLPVVIENDANATAVAEWKWGAGRGARNMVYLTQGTGIGGGLILDGRLYRGTNDLAGEVGHQTILPEGPLCGCGKRGCLEALASGPAIARLARESLHYRRGQRLVELAGGRPADITARHVVEAAREGDSFSRAILEEAGTYMGIGLANIIQILNPERIVLGTIAVHAGDLILNAIRRTVAERAWERAYSVCEIVPAALGDRAQDLAAIAIIESAANDRR